jgi:hypothetical protein
MKRCGFFFFFFFGGVEASIVGMAFGPSWKSVVERLFGSVVYMVSCEGERAAAAAAILLWIISHQIYLA